MQKELGVATCPLCLNKPNKLSLFEHLNLFLADNYVNDWRKGIIRLVLLPNHFYVWQCFR